jgi:hypothetical protein
MYETSVVNTAPFNIFLLRRANVWYSMADGEWSNPDTWISNALDRKNVTVPQPGDTVYVNHTVNYSNSNIGTYLFNRTVKYLYIGPNGKLTATTGGLNQNCLQITGDLRCDGTIDFSTTGSTITLELQGYFNLINTFSAGTQSTVYYTGTMDQFICPVTYYKLSTSNGVKYAVGNFTVNNLLTINDHSLELLTYDASFGDISLQGTLSKNGAGTVSVTNASTTNFGVGGAVSFTGNPTVNWTGNMTGDLRYGVNFGSGTFNFLSNLNLNFSNNANYPGSIGSNSFLIASGKTVTVIGPAAWLNNGTVTGVDGTSILNITGGYAYGTPSAAMPTGVFNYNFSGTSAIWIYTNMTVPYSSFYQLRVNNSATATLGANTAVTNLNIDSGTLEFSTYNFTASGTITYNGTISKSGSGTVSLGILNPQNGTGKIDFSAGNPTVNLSGNISGDVRAGFSFGSGTVNITSSITIGTWISGNAAASVGSCNFLIASGVTFTNVGQSNTTGGINVTGTINGVDSTSIFINKSILNYANAQEPMQTGKLYCNQAINTFNYQLSGNQNIQVLSDPTNPGCYNLTLSGSGSKTLLGNVSVKNTYTLTSPATLNTNGFALTNP